MKLAACIHKAVSLDPEVVPAETVLEMATINGARALGLAGEIGSIEAGKKADLIVIDLERAHLVPMLRAVPDFVHNGQARDVQSVMVDGKWLMRGRKLLTIDEQLLKQKVMQNAASAAHRAKIPEEQRWPVH